MSTFKAYRIHSDGDDHRAGFESMQVDALTEGDVVVEVAWSGINYKDALAATGKGKILRVPELNGGIDLAGHVLESGNDRFSTGDAVFTCGFGLSETRDGGYAEKARLPAHCLRHLPDGLTVRDTMAIGTAGFTAALALIRMEDNRQRKDDGPILVTGATGGVGSIAIDLLTQTGHEVTASSGKSSASDYLTSLGASDVIGRHEPGDEKPKPLQAAQWAGAIDSVGGDTLAWLCATTKPWGNIATIGLAGGASLKTTVMPFILRGVTLLGCNSIDMADALRDEIWQRLASDLKPGKLDRIATETVAFTELPDAFEAYMAGDVVGRTLVEVNA